MSVDVQPRFKVGDKVRLREPYLIAVFENLLDTTFCISKVAEYLKGGGKNLFTIESLEFYGYRLKEVKMTGESDFLFEGWFELAKSHRVRRHKRSEWVNIIGR